MSDYIRRAEGVVRRIHELAAISEDEGFLCRRYGTAAYLTAAGMVLRWMREAGLEARIDAIGNVRGRLRGRGGLGKTLVIGSHIDTVVDAGKWDGPLGVLMGLDLLERLTREDICRPFDIELIAFCDEEGVRFHTTYLGSRVVTGQFDPALLDLRDKEGVSLRQAVLDIGGDPDQLEREAIVADEWLGYFEIHIEQGPVLYARRLPVAGVSAIAGQIRASVRYKGTAGHAGTVPMDMRADALCGIAEMILAVEGMGVGEGVMATVGKVEVKHAASNVIPGEVVCSVDIRSDDQELLGRVHVRLRDICMAIAGRRGLRAQWDVLQAGAVVRCDEGMTGLIQDAMGASGLEPLVLVSGAGHDAVPVSAVAPVSMLFVRCFEGISHHPGEDVETNDIAAAIAVADEFVNRVIWKYQH